MKLLFDQNLSPALVKRLADLFPDSSHVFWLSLDQSKDAAVWQFAEANGFTIVSKDEDFNLFSVSHAAPPKVIWLLLGNCSTAEVETAIRSELEAIRRLEADPELSTLIIR
jgi:predicted nuclease of predicted toxin-antitoxin system